MIEKTYETSCGMIHYWISKDAENTDAELIFLPGLTADYRLFDKQIAFLETKFPVLCGRPRVMLLPGLLN